MRGQASTYKDIAPAALVVDISNMPNSSPTPVNPAHRAMGLIAFQHPHNGSSLFNV